jgi:hypothetical protein
MAFVSFPNHWPWPAAHYGYPVSGHVVECQAIFLGQLWTPYILVGTMRVSGVNRLRRRHAVMRNYRVYFLPDGNTVHPPNVIKAADDMDAIQRAKALLDGHDLEVWDETRLVITILASTKRLGRVPAARSLLQL